MIDEIDIYRSANIFIEKYGEEAKSYAALQALSISEELDQEGLSVWCRIVSAIEVLQNSKSSCVS